MNDNVDHSQATTVLILGILSIVCCQLLGPVAWTMGNNYVNTCLVEGVEPQGTGVAGRVLGIIGTVLFLLNILLGCLGGILELVVIGANQ